jgi:multiple sugar transport system permease protein
MSFAKRSVGLAPDGMRLGGRQLRYWPAYAVLGLWTLVCLFPFYWIAVTSLKGEAEIVRGPFYLPFVDFAPSFDAWAYVLFYPYENLFGRFLNSASVAVASTLLTLLVAGMAAYGLTRFRYAVPWRGIALGFLVVGLAGSAVLFPGHRVLLLAAAAIALVPYFVTGYFRRGPALSGQGILIAIVATRILPPVVIVLPLYLAAHAMGILDTRSGLILTYAAVNLPVAVWLLQGVFGKAATDQEEAALLDGATHFRIFAEILVPTVAAGIAAVGLLVVTPCWTEYLLAAYLTGERAMTLPPWVVGQMSVKEAQVGGDQIEWARLSASVVVMMAPFVVCAALAMRLVRRMSFWTR